MKVKLMPYELYLGAIVGMRRHILSLNSPEMNIVKNKNFSWATDIEAACGEVAVAKALNLFWDGSVNTFKRPDLQPDIQVRQTEEDDGRLIVRPKDKPNERYFLVTGKWGDFVLRGWILGEDAKVDENHTKGYNGMPDAWMVPQSRLLDINSCSELEDNDAPDKEG